MENLVWLAADIIAALPPQRIEVIPARRVKGYAVHALCGAPLKEIFHSRVCCHAGFGSEGRLQMAATHRGSIWHSHFMRPPPLDSSTQANGSRPLRMRPFYVILRFVKEGVHGPAEIDRKSTRLNSSHLVISHAVFCLKK